MRVGQDIKHLANCRVEVDESKLLALVTLEMWISSVNPFFMEARLLRRNTKAREINFSNSPGQLICLFQIQVDVFS